MGLNPLIAILHYRRPELLKGLLDSLAGGAIKIVVFDDYSLKDINFSVSRNNLIIANEHGGVARNSNRAIKYFKERKNLDVLFILNDDLLVDPKVFQIYLDAIEKTGYDFFSYTDKLSPYKPSAEFIRNGVSLVRRRTGDGCFTVMTRKAVEVLGGFDVNFGLFGGEDLDMQRRASAAKLCMDSLDVKAAAGLIKPRQYYENIPRALGSETGKHLALGREYWLETMNEDPIIWKECIY